MKTKILASVIVLFHTILSFGQVPGLVSGNLNITAFPTSLGGGKFQVSGTFSDPTGRWFAADVDTGMIMWKGNDLFKIDSIILQSGSSLTFRVVDSYSVGFIATGNAQVLELSPNLKIPGVAPSGDSNAALTPAPDHASLMNYIVRTMDERVGRAAKQDTTIFASNNTEADLTALGDVLGGRNMVTLVVTKGASAVNPILPPITTALAGTKFKIKVYATTGVVGMFQNDDGFTSSWDGTNFQPDGPLIQISNLEEYIFWPVVDIGGAYWAYSKTASLPQTTLYTGDGALTGDREVTGAFTLNLNPTNVRFYNKYNLPNAMPIAGANRKNIMVWTNGVPAFENRYATDTIIGSVALKFADAQLNSRNVLGFTNISSFRETLGDVRFRDGSTTLSFSRIQLLSQSSAGNRYSFTNLTGGIGYGLGASGGLYYQGFKSLSSIYSSLFLYTHVSTDANRFNSIVLYSDSTSNSDFALLTQRRSSLVHVNAGFGNITQALGRNVTFRTNFEKYAIQNSYSGGFFDWFRIRTPSNDTIGNYLEFYNGKYALPNASPGLGSKVIQWNNGTPSFAEVKRDTTVSYNNLDYNLLTVGLTSAQVKNRYNNIIVTGYVPSSGVTSDALFFLPPPSADYNQVTIWLNALDENATYGIGISAGVNDVMLGDGTYSNQYPPGALTPGQTLRIRCQMDPKDSNNYKWILN